MPSEEKLNLVLDHRSGRVAFRRFDASYPHCFSTTSPLHPEEQSTVATSDHGSPQEDAGQEAQGSLQNR